MSFERLTRDDLDDLSDSASDVDDPVAVATRLVRAARSGGLVDDRDTGYAYRLAAEIHERAGDLKAALALAEDGVEACQRHRAPELGPARAHRARLLMQLGRGEDAMAELELLRPLMITDPFAGGYVADVLEAGGYAETALRWLTEALAEQPAGEVASQLATSRDRIRAGLEPAGDLFEEYDGYDELSPEELYQLGDHPLREVDPVLLVWPPDEYEQIDQRWPEVLEPIGAESWQEYRRQCQALISRWAARGLPLSLVTGSADGFEEWLADQGADPVSVDLVAMADGYGDHLVDQGAAVELPPDPADPCWCGSGTSYARCCLPLA